MTPDETQVTDVPVSSPLDAVIDGWARLFGYLAILTVVGIAVMVPFVGVVIALPGALYLRAGDAHARHHPGGLLRLLAGPLTSPLDLLRGLLGTLLSLPYAVAVTWLVPYLIMLFGATGVEVHPLVAAAWGVGAGVYVLGAGPGLRPPRRQLVRIFTALAPDPTRIAVAGAVLCVLVVAAMAGAVALQPSFAPLYELKNSVAQTLGRFQDSVQQHVS